MPLISIYSGDAEQRMTSKNVSNEEGDTCKGFAMYFFCNADWKAQDCGVSCASAQTMDYLQSSGTG
jgi:hypothetical protein